MFDLDGVLWRGRREVEGAGESLQRLADASVGLVFATNNSTRTPDEVAMKISDLTGFSAAPESVVTSSMAGASILEQGDSPTFVVGERGVAVALETAGLAITSDPSLARSVMVGLAREVDYRQIANASTAIRSGARFVATNTDPTFPTETGLEPGSGAIVAAIATAAGRPPEVAGKPGRPMIDLIKARGVRDAVVVGDRLDTDIAMAAAEPGWTSILVLSGVTAAEDPNTAQADHVTPDVRAAVDLLLGELLRQ